MTPWGHHLPPDLHAEVTKRAEELERSISWYIRNTLQVSLQSPSMADPSKPLADLWAISDEAGKPSGHTYEVTVAFALPAIGNNHDYAAYDIRDALIATVVDMGARDPVTRLISLCGMQERKTLDMVDGGTFRHG